MAYIDREKLLEKKTFLPISAIGDFFITETDIKSLPTADVIEVKHGKWIYSKTYYEADECNCSLCGQLMTTEIGIRTNYCPNCGAKMDGEKGNE